RLPDFHFEVLPGERVPIRAAEALKERFRDLERKENWVDFDAYALPEGGRGSLTLLEIDVKPLLETRAARADDRPSIFGGDERKLNGEAELRKTGRLLNALYPDDLRRALGRDAETSHLKRWLESVDRRAVILTGPRLVGKTAIIHECLWQMLSSKTTGQRRKLWTVSPMRLISGMSYVGQWENRVKAICEYVERSDSILFIEDLPALFTAGISANSDLNVAHLLKPFLERRAIRLLAEITPESWSILRERDRAFSDFFNILPVREPSETETLRILVSVMRTAEQQHGTKFDLDVVPAAHELFRRFSSDAAFPGKAAEFLNGLAARYNHQSCSRFDALVEFQERSGMQFAILSPTHELLRKEIVDGLRKGVTGQDEVLQAFADAVLALKAQLNDPRRPIAVFLLLGPTGVGKTQCAKALANYLFGDPGRLLRFDMNEMADSSAVSRLAGTPAEPDGLLTGAVRRQPLSVILFDEIEKAASEVLDLLLGVLDEGRLADALGRVADFRSSIILLTSNLGAQKAGGRISFSFGRNESEQRAAYVSAAEKFFRPEFFNRLDRVLPFNELRREHLCEIAERHLSELLQREGLRQRQCIFEFADGAADRLAELGSHPELGARALKRVIEREVGQRLAAVLSARPPGLPLQIELELEHGNFSLSTRELHHAVRTIRWPEHLRDATETEVIRASKAALARLSARLDAAARPGKVSLDALSSEQRRYYQCREQTQRAREASSAAEAALEDAGHGAHRPQAFKRPKSARQTSRFGSSEADAGRAREADAFRSQLSEVINVGVAAPDSEDPLWSLICELILLEAAVVAPHLDDPVGLLVKGHGPFAYKTARNFISILRHFLEAHGFASEMALEERNGWNEIGPFQEGLSAAGLNIRRLLAPLSGTWLLQDKDGKLELLHATIVVGSPDAIRRQCASDSFPVPDGGQSHSEVV
ncbi:MAG TPA: AAA family ATPase, partial [Chthoniobacteraceae bacterium]